MMRTMEYFKMRSSKKHGRPQVLSGQLTKQFIQDLDCSIALNKDFVLALNNEIQLLKLNTSEHSTLKCAVSVPINPI